MTVQDTLAGLPHFRLLDREVLERIAVASHVRTLDGGTRIFTEGEPCHAFFAIRRGAVKLYRSTPDGREQVVHHLHEGQTFAEAALFHIGRFPASAVALETPTEIVEVGGEVLLELFRTDHRVARAMIGSLCVRLFSLVERVEELSLVQASSRLARYLLRLSATGPATRPVVELPIAKKDLAAHLAMTPETLSRLLRRWQDERWIELDRARVTLLAPGELSALADGEMRAN